MDNQVEHISQLFQKRPSQWKDRIWRGVSWQPGNTGGSWGVPAQSEIKWNMQSSLLAGGVLFGPSLKVDGPADGVVDPVRVCEWLSTWLLIVIFILTLPLLTPEIINNHQSLTSSRSEKHNPISREMFPPSQPLIFDYLMLNTRLCLWRVYSVQPDRRRGGPDRSILGVGWREGTGLIVVISPDKYPTLAATNSNSLQSLLINVILTKYLESTQISSNFSIC